MTISGFSNAFIGTMLGWLKGLANWVLRLFNLAGRTGASPLLWLSENWIKLLVVFLLIGVVADIVVWLVRWRPYWVWFRKERVIVNDEKFFAGGRIDHQRFTEDDDLVEDNWQERDFVVASSVARKPESKPRRREEEAPRRGRSEETRVPERRPVGKKRRGTVGTIVKRAKDGEESLDEGDALFGLESGSSGVTDSYEDEVFNVSNLPDPEEYKHSESEADSLFSLDDD